MLNKFFSLFSSNDSYHQSNISVMSAANRLCNSILGTIYYKFTDYISSIIKNKVLDPEQNDELHKLFPEPSENKNFPEDYADELHVFHKIIPTIKCKDPISRKNYNDTSEYDAAIKSLKNDITEELKKPIETTSQLVMMVTKWLRLQEIWGNDFDDVYCVTKIEEGNGTATFEELFTHEYNDEVFQKYLAVKARQGRYNYGSVYKWELKKILRTPEGLKNLILMFGLEYSFIAKTGGKCGGHQVYQYPQFQLNSAINILNDEYCTQALIKIPLIHLAVAKGILPEVSFLLTEDNVNCKSYQGLHYVPKNPTQLEQEARMVLQNTLVILDTPLKIAIDNFDDAALQLLIDHNADAKINVRPGLGLCDARPNSTWDYYTLMGIPACTQLVDYFMGKEPQEEKQTKSYIAMANLLCRSFQPGGDEQINFLNKAAEKKLTIYSELTGATTDEILLTLLPPKVATKSARKVALQDIPKEKEIKKVEESDTTDENIANSGEPTEENDNLLTTTAYKNDLAKDILSNFSGGTPSNSMSHIVDTIPVVGDNCFLPIFDNLAITKG